MASKKMAAHSAFVDKFPGANHFACFAPAINNRSQIVGVSENGISDSTCPTPQSPFEPVIWYKGQLPLLTIAGDPDGFASAINDQGDAAGDTANCTFSSVQGLTLSSRTERPALRYGPNITTS